MLRAWKLSGPVCSRKHRPSAPPEHGSRGQAVIGRLLATVSGLEACERDAGGFEWWISARPGHLPCGCCCQAAKVLAEDMRCAACAGLREIRAGCRRPREDQ